MFPVIKNYTIVREIGTGGMAVVYEATDNRLQRTVAIKVLHPHLHGEPSITERFIREARAAAKIDHPHVVRLFDYGSEDDLHYFIMEYVPGTTMERVLKAQGALLPENGIAVMSEIAEALAQAHSLGIIHRDVKPANILLHRQGRAMLSDFGLAHHPADPRLTTDDAVAGTPSFMSPEQMAGREITTATDIYSWGVCLYAIVSGKLPYASETFPDVLTEIRRGEVRFDREILNRLPSRLHDILHRSLAADPRQRINDANELIRRLALTVKKRPWSIDPTTLHIATMDEGSGEQASSASVTAILPRSRPRRKRIMMGTAALLAAIAVGTALITLRRPSISSPDEKVLLSNDHIVKQTNAQGETGAMGRVMEDTLAHAAAPTGRQPSDGATLPIAGQAVSERQPDTLHLPPKSGAEFSPGTRPRSAETTRPPADSPFVSTVPDSGALFVYCSPWAAVTVGGIAVGTTPFEKPIALPAGRHVITLTNSFCEPLADTVDVPAGEVVRKRYSLKVRR